MNPCRVPSYSSPHIIRLLEPSRAPAIVWTPPPGATRTQKLTELSSSGDESFLASTPYWPVPLVKRTPELPTCDAAPEAATLPVLPTLPSQLLSEPDSNPSVNSTFEKCGGAVLGVMAIDAADSGLVPAPLIAATVKV